MLKYKIGDVLKVKEGCEDVCGGYASKKGCFIEINQCVSADNSSTDYYRYYILNSDKEKIGTCCRCLRDEHLIPLTKTWETLECGDILINERQRELKVLGILNELVFISLPESFKEADGSPYTKHELQRDGFTLKGATEDIEELTVAEISKRLGKTIKVIE